VTRNTGHLLPAPPNAATTSPIGPAHPRSLGRNPSATPIRFRAKRAAEKAAYDAEATVRGGERRDPATGPVTFGEHPSRWCAAQDLAASTMQNYRRHIEEHLLPTFESKALADILAADIDVWQKHERGGDRQLG
jgi:hypothetical protein